MANMRVEIVRLTFNHGFGILVQRPAGFDFPFGFVQLHDLKILSLLHDRFFAVRTIAFVLSGVLHCQAAYTNLILVHVFVAAISILAEYVRCIVGRSGEQRPGDGGANFRLQIHMP